ncbi:hypothetical protein OG790_34080 (plasmid) [Streptomyces cellulosae]
MFTTTAPAGSPRYVYPARTTEGWVLHWQASTTLPQGPALTGDPKAVPAITGGTPVPRPRALRGA